MSKIAEEIREALKPYHVQGFTATCFPMPTIQQMDQLMSEVRRLEIELAKSESGAAQLMRNEESVTAERDRYKAALEAIVKDRPGYTACLDIAETALMEAAEAVQTERADVVKNEGITGCEPWTDAHGRVG